MRARVVQVEFTVGGRIWWQTRARIERRKRQGMITM